MTTLAFGMIPNVHVDEVLERLHRFFDQGWTAIIRSIDSSHSLHGLVEILNFHCIAYKVACGNVCLSISQLQMALNERVFTGFDEVWIVTGAPPTLGLSQVPSITSEGTESTEGMPDGLAQVMEKANSVLILGDGCGLNYATLSEQFRKEIEETCP